jgi:hypothetical protein
VENNPSEPCGTSLGLRQGDTLLHILFKITLEKLARDLGTEFKEAIYKNTIQILAYADDIALSGRATDVLEAAIIYCSKATKKMGLSINLQQN